jgi:hypothetical protein
MALKIKSAMHHYKYILVVFLLSISFSYGQFPGAAGTLGSTAIFKDSSIFVSWATQCTVQRGYQDITTINLGYASTGDSSLVIGQADGIQVVSLGDGGSAIVEFEKPIKNGPGFDFAVFENGFIDEFLELAFVEVSSDGINFFRFKATSNTQTDVQVGPFDYNADATLLNNLAGKYRAMYGTPFDLEEMSGIQGLNVDSIVKVKVIDVIGAINPIYASYDQNNNMINEHFPTPFPQGGFDLDAVGVIHQLVNGVDKAARQTIHVYPNPINDQLFMDLDISSIDYIQIIDELGSMIKVQTQFNNNVIHLGELKAGIYCLNVILKNGAVKRQTLVKITP